MGIVLSDDQRLFLKRKIESLESEIVDIIPGHDKYSSTHEWELVKTLESKQKTLDALNRILYYSETKSIMNLMK